MNAVFIPAFERKWILHLIFIRIPKNASTSIYNHLGEFNLVNKYSRNFQANANNLLYKNWFDPTHAKPFEIASALPVKCCDYFSFAVVRNPWDRFVSMYFFANKMELWKLFGLRSQPDFKIFCSIAKEKWSNKDSYFFPTQDQMQWLEGPFLPKKIIRFETLEKDFANMIQELKIDHISQNLPHLNSTTHNAYRDYYDSQSRKLVEQIFHRDIETFKYIY